jgi:hypothetical protein
MKGASMAFDPKPGRVVQINVNPRGGVPKYPVPSAEVTMNGVIGDKQRDRRPGPRGLALLVRAHPNYRLPLREEPIMARPPIHPGEILADELDELDMCAAELARTLHVPTNRIT